MRVMSTSFCSAAWSTRGRRDHVGKGVGEVTLPNALPALGMGIAKNCQRAERVTVTP